MTYRSFSLIIPVYNQADHIEQVIDGYIEKLNLIPCLKEYILVVNGSRDNSHAICCKIRQKYEGIKVIEMKQGGWGLAVKRGLQECTGDLISYTNVARTSPQDLSLLLHYALSNPNHVIKANRKIRESLQRRIGSLLYNLECRTLFDLAYWDVNGTPKIFPRAFDKLLELGCNDDLIDLEFNIVCRKQNYPLLEVPIYSTKRAGGKTTTGYHSALRLYVGALKLWWNTKKQERKK